VDIRLGHCFPARAANYRPLVGTGLEVGGPSAVFQKRGLWPAYPFAERIDNCTFHHQTVWGTSDGTFKVGRGKHYIAEGGAIPVPSGSYDFLLTCDVLEHMANPLGALAEWRRVLKPGGRLIMIVPDPRQTFDHRRPVTSLEHLIADQDKDESDLTHLPEILELHDLQRDPLAGTFEEFKARSADNLHNRCLHHHVFSEDLARAVVTTAGFEVSSVGTYRPCHILVVAEKRADA
jgi:SAM-dependent methyltransferase